MQRRDPVAGSLRLFVALELPSEVLRALAEVRAAVEQQAQAQGVGRDLAQTARWVRPEGVHLTLKFLGETAGTLAPEIEIGMRRASTGQPCFRLGLQAIGAFPNLRRARVLWVGLSGEVQPLLSLHRLVEAELGLLGFPAENRPFHPHLTLARLERGLPEALIGGLERLAVPQVEWAAEGVSLMRSELLRDGARYTRLAFTPLEKARGR